MRGISYDLATARVKRYVEDFVTEKDWARYGLHEPILDLGFASEKLEGRLRIGNEDVDNQVFAQRNENSTVITTTSQFVRITDLTMDLVLDSNPIFENYDLLDSLTVRWHSGEEITAVRVLDRWGVRPPRGFEGPADRFDVPLQNVIYGLEGLGSDQKVILAKRGGREEYMPIRKISYSLYWPEYSVEVQLGWRSGEDAHWIQINDASELYRIKRDLFFRLRGLLLAADLIDPNS